MPFRVVLTEDAARDLKELSDYLEKHKSPRKAQIDCRDSADRFDE